MNEIKHPRFVFRKIKNGKMKWNRRYWKPRGDVSHIEGKTLVFGTYAPEYKLVCLWGTPVFYYLPYDYIDDTKLGDAAWQEVCEIMGVRIRGNGINVASGSFSMQQKGEKWIAYKSRGIDFWKEVTNEPR